MGQMSPRVMMPNLFFFFVWSLYNDFSGANMPNCTKMISLYSTTQGKDPLCSAQTPQVSLFWAQGRMTFPFIPSPLQHLFLQ